MEDSITIDYSSQQKAHLSLSQKLQKCLDDITPFPTLRWLIALGLILSFMIRVVIIQKHFLLAYTLGVYQLQLFVAFCSPIIDPAMEELRDDTGPSLPTQTNEEFRPFIRRLPEFKFWSSVVKSTLLSIFLTFFKILDFPIYWPLLLIYFILTFCIMMKHQILHMLRYKYLPFTHNKPKFQDTGEIEKLIEDNWLIAINK